MICSAWLISAICALPQSLVFRVLKHPQIEFYQCTSMNFFSDLFNSSSVNGGAAQSPNFYSLTPEMAEKMYSSLFLVRLSEIFVCMQGDHKKLPNVHKSCPKIIPLEKMKDFNTFTKIA